MPVVETDIHKYNACIVVQFVPLDQSVRSTENFQQPNLTGRSLPSGDTTCVTFDSL